MKLYCYDKPAFICENKKKLLFGNKALDERFGAKKNVFC